MRTRSNNRDARWYATLSRSPPLFLANRHVEWMRSGALPACMMQKPMVAEPATRDFTVLGLLGIARPSRERTGRYTVLLDRLCDRGLLATRGDRRGGNQRQRDTCRFPHAQCIALFRANGEDFVSGRK